MDLLLKIRSFFSKIYVSHTEIKILITLIILAFVASFIWYLTTISEKSDSNPIKTCSNNQRVIMREALLYLDENEHIFPANLWHEVSINEENLICPSSTDKNANSYGYNVNLIDINKDDIKNPLLTVIIADSDDRNNAIFSLSDISFRHGDTAVVGFVDGSVKWGFTFNDLFNEADILIPINENNFEKNKQNQR